MKKLFIFYLIVFFNGYQTIAKATNKNVPKSVFNQFGANELQAKKTLMKENIDLFTLYFRVQTGRRFTNSLEEKNAKLEFEIMKLIVEKSLRTNQTYNDIKKANLMIRRALGKTKSNHSFQNNLIQKNIKI